MITWISGYLLEFKVFEICKLKFKKKITLILKRITLKLKKMTRIFKIFWLKYQDLNFQKDKLNCLEMQLNMEKKLSLIFKTVSRIFKNQIKKKNEIRLIGFFFKNSVPLRLTRLLVFYIVVREHSDEILVICRVNFHMSV